MHKVRAYFQGHPFVHWLTTVVFTLLLIMTGGLLIHEMNWPLAIWFSVGVPTMTAFLKSIEYDKKP